MPHPPLKEQGAWADLLAEEFATALLTRRAQLPLLLTWLGTWDEADLIEATRKARVLADAGTRTINLVLLRIAKG